MTDIDVSVTSDDWSTALPDAERIVRRAVLAALDRLAPGRPVALCVGLAGDEEVRDLNRTWRGHDRPTNVLSFPSGELDGGVATTAPGMPPFAGDVVLAFGVVRDEAAAAALPLDHHLSHLVVHGVMHLFGHDHAADDEAERMERMEAEALAGLGIPDPYRADAETREATP